MPNIPFPGPYPTTITHILVHHAVAPARPRTAKPLSQFVRRRPTPQQGRALELLGHAVEYLLDEALYRSDGNVPEAGTTEAADILMRLSREVFAECREIFPERRSLKSRLLRLITLSQQMLAAKH